MKPAKPVVKAILICDQVIQEKGTNKNSLIGIFENINVRQFPAYHPRLGVYVNFTGALGKYSFKLELYSIDNNKVVQSGEIPAIEYKDKLSSNSLVFNFPLIKFDKPGKYAFRIWANSEQLEDKTFNVKKT